VKRWSAIDRDHTRLLASVAGVLAVMAAGCGGSSPRSVADRVGTTLPHTVTTSPATTTLRTATRLATGPTKFVDEWAACERAHGDLHQPVPTIDAHGVINITAPFASPGSVHIRGGPEPATGTCSTYLNKARRALRAAHPVRDPNGPDHATQLHYVRCMRANGVPKFPYPEAHSSKTNFNGTGINPDSPAVLRENNLCGKKLGLPTWWIKGWGMPGDISVKAPAVPDDQ
jgi:hypothetical protein